MKINVVVVTYNRKKLLKECIESLLNQTYNYNKVILIDNDSNDGTYEMLIENQFIENKRIEYIKLDKNIGGAGGFYEGLKKSYLDGADWSWIMDDDTIPEEDALEELVKYVSENKSKKISYLSSYVYGLDNNPSNKPIFIDKSKNEISGATFVSLLINNDAISKIGLPMKDYFIWGDDTEYTLRLTRFYGPAYFVDKSRVLHKRKGSIGLNILKEDNINRVNFWYYMVRNNLNNYNTYYGTLKMLKQVLYYNCLILKCIFLPNVKFRLKKCKSLFMGINDYIFKKYDYNAFNNRFDFNVKYKNV